MAERSPATGEPAASEVEGSPTEIKIFLFADVRGYTRFTQDRGDEAAARLAAKFALVAKEILKARGGSGIEYAGDEVLAVFSSPRQAIRAAIELQARFVEETAADPTLPLRVGVGLDAGEAVPLEEGIAGGALNTAARLCALAATGEGLASREVGHLARRVEGVRFLEQGPLQLNGIAHPVHVIDVKVANVKIWDVVLSDDAEWAALPVEERWPGGASFTPDGRQIVATGRRDGRSTSMI